MSGGKHRGSGRVIIAARKGVLLTADERAYVLALLRAGVRLNVTAIARAIGRSVPDVSDFLNSPEATHG